jgi:hypothetical protein
MEAVCAFETSATTCHMYYKGSQKTGPQHCRKPGLGGGGGCGDVTKRLFKKHRLNIGLEIQRKATDDHQYSDSQYLQVIHTERIGQTTCNINRPVPLWNLFPDSGYLHAHNTHVSSSALWSVADAESLWITDRAGHSIVTLYRWIQHRTGRSPSPQGVRSTVTLPVLIMAAWSGTASWLAG